MTMWRRSFRRTRTKRRSRSSAIAAGDRGDRETDAEEVDDEADDGELQVEPGHADTREGQDHVLHEEVDDGAPDGGGSWKRDSIEEREHAGKREVNGGCSQRDDEVADETQDGGFGAACVGGLAAEESGGDDLEKPSRSQR